jgi:hypothetical protein
MLTSNALNANLSTDPYTPGPHFGLKDFVICSLLAEDSLAAFLLPSQAGVRRLASVHPEIQASSKFM